MRDERKGWLLKQIDYVFNACRLSSKLLGCECSKCPKGDEACDQARMELRRLIQQKPKVESLRFSEARAVDFLFEHFIDKPGNRAVNCVYNFLHYAERRGWLNTAKVKKDLTPFRVTKIIRWNNMRKPKVKQSWLPTAENINALPDSLRKYVADLETNADPAGMIQENMLLRDTIDQLKAKLALQRPELVDMKKYVHEKAEKMVSMFLHPNTPETNQHKCEDFITQIIGETRGLQDVPVVRIKPERMDHMEKGAKFGKSKSGPEEEKFPYECCEKCDRLIKQFACKGVLNAIECLYLLSKMKIKKKGGD